MTQYVSIDDEEGPAAKKFKSDDESDDDDIIMLDPPDDDDKSEIKSENKDDTKDSKFSPNKNLDVNNNGRPRRTSSEEESNNEIACPKFSNPSDPKGISLMRQQLYLLLHARKCTKDEDTYKPLRDKKLDCILPHCKTMKVVLKHLTECKTGRGCNIPLCSYSKQTLYHWKKCDGTKCAPEVPSDSVLKGESKPKKVEDVTIDDDDDDEEDDDDKDESAPSLPSNSEVKVAANPLPKTKEWQHQINPSLRDRIVYKLIQAMFPTVTPDMVKDDRLTKLVTYAKKVEGDMYGSAETRQAYYRMLAENISKIQKELEEKRAKRNFDERVKKAAAIQKAIHKKKLEERPIIKVERNAPLGLNKARFSREELKEALMPPLLTMYNLDPEGIPFRLPVDPIALGIPDYFKYISYPMDISTIQKKLSRGEYETPWEYVEDVYAMFENAWIYNKKISRVYKYTTRLCEVFEAEIDPIMQSLGYCCGRKYLYQPVNLSRFGQPDTICTITKDGVYYIYENKNPTPILLLDRYVFCQKCFNNVPSDVIRIGDENVAPNDDNIIPKADFVE